MPVLSPSPPLSYPPRPRNSLWAAQPKACRGLFLALLLQTPWSGTAPELPSSEPHPASRGGHPQPSRLCSEASGDGGQCLQGSRTGGTVPGRVPGGRRVWRGKGARLALVRMCTSEVSLPAYPESACRPGLSEVRRAKINHRVWCSIKTMLLLFLLLYLLGQAPGQ